MKLKKLELADFQAHERLELEFSPAITSIQGPTDRGKSAILRAIRWICLNDFPGEEFIREGSREARAILEISTQKEGHSILRLRGTGGNLYRLDDGVFKAFGQGGVPDPVAKLLGLSELNFQAQHDSPFWFAKSAGEVSRELNSIIDLSVIDTSLASAASKVRMAQDRLATCKERIVQIGSQLEQMKPARERIDDFAQLKETQTRLEKRRTKYVNLSALLLRAKACGIISIPPDFSEVEKLYGQWFDMDQKESRLRSLMLRSFELSATVDQLIKQSKRLEEEFHQKIKGTICPTCGKRIE